MSMGAFIFVVAGLAGTLALPIAEVKRSDPVDFEREILPVLKNNCLACHNQTKAKAGLVLETPQSILKGGDSGPAVVPGNPGESLLFKAAAHTDDDTKMPPKDNKVNAADYVVWRKGVGTTYIDSDYDSWRANFGKTYANGAGASLNAVPEPGNLKMLLLGAVLLVPTRGFRLGNAALRLSG